MFCSHMRLMHCVQKDERAPTASMEWWKQWGGWSSGLAWIWDQEQSRQQRHTCPKRRRQRRTREDKSEWKRGTAEKIQPQASRRREPGWTTEHDGHMKSHSALLSVSRLDTHPPVFHCTALHCRDKRLT